MDITIQNFETDLIQASMTQPVLLDIWAPWCGPCRALTPVLEALEQSYEGRFKLAKLNADEQPQISGQLSQMFGVRSIPFCVLFKEGQPVDGFVGALPQAKIEEFLNQHVPAAPAVQEETTPEAALSPESAIEKLQEAVATDPGNDALRFNYLRALLMAARVQNARAAFEPVASKAPFDTQLAAIASWLDAHEQAAKGRSKSVLHELIQTEPRDFAARFELAQTHFAEQAFTAALDELLEIILRNKTWNDQQARKTYVAILTLMTQPTSPSAQAVTPVKGTLEITGKVDTTPSDPVIDQYRRRLSMALF